MEFETPDDFKDTMKKWMRDPNGWIAICTIILVFSGFYALHISRDTEKRQLRAYVSPVLKSGGAFTENESAIEITIENFGQTPAKNCFENGEIKILPYPLPKGYVFKNSFKHNAESYSSIYPKADNAIIGWLKAGRAFTKAEIEEITSNNSHRRAYAFGTLTYADIFNESHFTNFCFVLDPNSIKKTKASIESIWMVCDRNTDFD